MNNKSFMKALGGFIGPILYIGFLGLAIFGLWKIRDRQPGNTRYSVAIYCGMGACILLIIFGFFIFGIFE